MCACIYICVWGSKIFALIFLSIIEALGGEIVEVYCMYSWFSIVSMQFCSCRFHIHGFSQPWIENIWGEIFFRKLKKQNMNLPCPGSYLHSIYIVMCILTKSRDDLKYMEDWGVLWQSCLGLGTFTFMAQVQSLIRELRSSKQCGVVSKYMHT